jgi:hypothetical protein
MKTLETNDWIILNTIIYKVYTMEDFDEMRKELLEQLKLLVDFDSADFYLASVEDEKKLDRPVMYNCDSNLSEEYEELDYSRGIMLSGKSLIYRETDIISDESRVETEYYKKVYKPNNWHYSLPVKRTFLISMFFPFESVVVFANPQLSPDPFNREAPPGKHTG